MALHKAPDGSLHDDMDGTALSLPIWPKDAVPITDEEAQSIRDEQTQQALSSKTMQVQVDPAQTLVDQISASPTALAELKKALGL